MGKNQTFTGGVVDSGFSFPSVCSQVSPSRHGLFSQLLIASTNASPVLRPTLKVKLHDRYNRLFPLMHCHSLCSFSNRKDVTAHHADEKNLYAPPTNTTSLLSRYPLHKNEEQPGHSFDPARHGINLHKAPQMRVNNLYRVIITPKHLKVKPQPR